MYKTQNRGNGRDDVPWAPAALLLRLRVSFHPSFNSRAQYLQHRKKEVAGAGMTLCGSINSCYTKMLNYTRWWFCGLRVNILLKYLAFIYVRLGLDRALEYNKYT